MQVEGESIIGDRGEWRQFDLVFNAFII